MNALDFAILFAFVAYGVWAGFAARRQASQGLDEYFLAGRSLSGWRAGASMAATQFAADTPLLVMGLIAVGGIASLWRLWIYGLAFLFMGFVLGSAWRRAGVLTDAELTMIRYSSRGATVVRAMKAVYYGTVINCTVMAFVLVAATRIFEVFLPWHEWLPAGAYTLLRDRVAALGLELHSGVTALDPATATTNSLLGIVATVAFVALYSTTGGLRSVVRTDIMQLALMLAGTAGYAFFAVDAAGGLDGLAARLADLYGAEQAQRYTSFAPSVEAMAPFLTVLALQWVFQMNADGTGYLAQRTMACASDRDAERAAVTFTLLQIVVRSLLWLLIALALLVVYPLAPDAVLDEPGIAARESLYALGAAELLPAGLRGLLITSLLAALASTIDTHLNWGASYWANDLYRGVVLERWLKRAPRDRELVLVARASTLVLLAASLWLMTRLGSIQTAWQISLLFGAGVGAVLVLRWLWERVNLLAEAASILMSLALAPLLLATVDDDWLRLAAMAAASTAVVVLAAIYGPATDPRRLAEFYRRVRPPGWWRASAIATGVAPALPLAELRQRLMQVLACAISTYAWLIGTTGLALGTHPLWASTLVLAAGFAAVPWWSGAFRASAATL
jgi:solute:Na+ symporter, SSS family